MRSTFVCRGINIMGWILCIAGIAIIIYGFTQMEDKYIGISYLIEGLRYLLLSFPVFGIGILVKAASLYIEKHMPEDYKKGKSKFNIDNLLK